MAERPRRRPDHLGLRSALADRLLPLLVGAMSFLAALAIGGTLAAATLAQHWQGDTLGALTIQVPAPDSPAATGGQTRPAATGGQNLPAATGGQTRLAAVLAALSATPGIVNPQPMSRGDVDRLLSPWLGADIGALALPIPAVITATWQNPGPPDALEPRLAGIAPGTLVATGAAWAGRIASLTASLQACAAAVLLIVALVAAAIVSVAIRSGLAQRREAIEIIHGLGALDSDIAGRFAARATWLTVSGAIAGALLALPVLFWLANLAAPFAGATTAPGLPGLPPALWISLPMLPLVAAIIGWSTTQLTVRGWLRRLA
jgi:cell division transport system permease protein